MRAIGRGFVVLDFGVGRTLWLVGGLYFAKTPPGGQAVDPPAQIRGQSRSHGQHAAPPGPPLPVPLRWPPAACPREPRLAPSAHRLQADGDPAQAPETRSALLGRAVQGVGGVEGGPRHRGSRHRPAVAAAPFPRALDQALRAARGGPPARQRRDHHPCQKNGRSTPALGRAQNSWRTPGARNRRSRAHRLSADREAAPSTLADLANIPDQLQSRSRSTSSRFLPLACASSSSSSCSSTIAAASGTSTCLSTPLPHGPPSRSWTLSRTTPRPPISSAIATRSTVTSSSSA